MTTSSKRALPGLNTKHHTRKTGATRTRTQTEKGKYNARSRKQTTPKTIPERGSESSDSSDNETSRPHKKYLRFTEETGSEDGEEVVCNTSSVEDVEVASNGGSESEIEVSIQRFSICRFAKHC